MSAVVLDASAVLAWLLGDDPALAERVEQAFSEQPETELVSPVLLRAEVANALLVAQRRQRLTTAQAAQASALADAVPLAHEPATQTVGELLLNAQTHGLSAYDAQYLELAMRRGARLLSADQALITAARAAGVPT